MGSLDTGPSDWVRGIYATLAARGVAVPAKFLEAPAQPAAREVATMGVKRFAVGDDVLEDWMPDWRAHHSDCQTLARLQALGLHPSPCGNRRAEASPVPTPPGLRAAVRPTGTHAERVRAALIGPPGARALPASDAPLPRALFSGVRPEERLAPPPIDMIARIAAAAKKGGVK